MFSLLFSVAVLLSSVVVSVVAGTVLSLFFFLLLQPLNASTNIITKIKTAMPAASVIFCRLTTAARCFLVNWLFVIVNLHSDFAVVVWQFIKQTHYCIYKRKYQVLTFGIK